MSKNIEMNKNGLLLSTEKVRQGYLPDIERKIYQQNPEQNYIFRIFYQKLTFNTHIERIKIEVERNINILRLLYKTRYGMYLYKVLIRPVFDYGYMIFCIGVMKSTPSDVLLLESGEMALSIRTKF